MSEAEIIKKLLLIKGVLSVKVELGKKDSPIYRTFIIEGANSHFYKFDCYEDFNDLMIQDLFKKVKSRQYELRNWEYFR